MANSRNRRSLLVDADSRAYAERLLQRLYADHCLEYQAPKWIPCAWGSRAYTTGIHFGDSGVYAWMRGGYEEQPRLRRVFADTVFGMQALHALVLHEFAHVLADYLRLIGRALRSSDEDPPNGAFKPHGRLYQIALADLWQHYPLPEEPECSTIAVAPTAHPAPASSGRSAS